VRNHPAIRYDSDPVHDPVSALNRRVASGDVRFVARGTTGVLGALLEALDVPIYARLWAVLSGSDRRAKYRYLARAERQTIVEILRDTQTDLPESFSGPVRRSCLATRCARVHARDCSTKSGFCRTMPPADP
jgi:hypothetical protein